MAFAFSCGIPCTSLISRRTVSFAAGVTAPSSRFFTDTPRLMSLDCRSSNRAFILKSSSATRVRVVLARSNAIDALDPLKSYRWATSLVAWLTALSTSWRSAPVEMSNDARPANLRQEAFERPGTTHVPQPRQGLLLELPHPLARDAEQRSDLLERHRPLALEPEVEPQDRRLAVLERGQHPFDRLGQGMLEDLVVGAGIGSVGQVVEQLVVLAGRQGSIEGQVGLRDRKGLGDLFFRDVHPFGDLLDGGLATQLLQ